MIMKLMSLIALRKLTCSIITFAQQTYLDDGSSVLPGSTNCSGPSLDNINLTQQEVQGILETLQLGKSTGPDNVNNRILKELSTTLSKLLCDLFYHSMSLSCVPVIWKEANVSPLYKKDDSSLVSNYRPISLLSALGKVTFFLISMQLLV